MSLDISFTEIMETDVFDTNITHNLGKLAHEVEIYYPLWRPEEVGITKAGELIEPLTHGLKLLKDKPDEFRPFGAKNGWGTYEQFVPWVERLLAACKEYPNAIIHVSR